MVALLCCFYSFSRSRDSFSHFKRINFNAATIFRFSKLCDTDQVVLKTYEDALAKFDQRKLSPLQDKDSQVLLNVLVCLLALI